MKQCMSIVSTSSFWELTYSVFHQSYSKHCPCYILSVSHFFQLNPLQFVVTSHHLKYMFSLSYRTSIDRKLNDSMLDASETIDIDELGVCTISTQCGKWRRKKTPNECSHKNNKQKLSCLKSVSSKRSHRTRVFFPLICLLHSRICKPSTQSESTSSTNKNINHIFIIQLWSEYFIRRRCTSCKPK